MPPSDTAEMIAELERLRTLVGPSEVAYEALRADCDHAVRAARAAELEAGDLRGRIAEISVQLARARQDQDTLLRRAEMSAPQRFVDRVRGRVRRSVVPRVRSLAAKVRRGGT